MYGFSYDFYCVGMHLIYILAVVVIIGSDCNYYYHCVQLSAVILPHVSDVNNIYASIF